jgi:hypothetical protein
MRLALGPSLILVSVTMLLAAYGSTRWSWIAGPVAAVATRALDKRTPEKSLRIERKETT